MKGVEEDPSVAREILGVPPQVRACDPARDGDGVVAFRRPDLEALSLNEICRRVIERRIAAETVKGRNVAPRVTPAETLEDGETYSPMISRRINAILQDCGCALSGA